MKQTLTRQREQAFAAMHQAVGALAAIDHLLEQVKDGPTRRPPSGEDVPQGESAGETSEDRN
jgi:hypothetical protein